MASLLNRILTLLGRAASNAVSDTLSQKSSTPSGTSESRPSGSAETAQARAPKSSAAKPSPTRPRAHDSGAAAGATAPSARGVSVYDVSTLGLPDFAYSPDPDGEADPGELLGGIGLELIVHTDVQHRSLCGHRCFSCYALAPILYLN